MDGVLWQTGSPAEVFAGFGASAYFNGQPALETLEVAIGHREVRRRLRALCPSSPGVYGMVDREGQLIYVGMSARLCDRLLTYFTAGDEGAKEQRIAKHDFERAIGHRDAFQELTYLSDQLQLLRDVARDFWFVYPIRYAEPSNLWNLIAGGDVVAVAPEPATKSERRALGALLEQTFMERDRQAPIPFEKFDRVRLVASWFRQRPEEMEKAVSLEDAIARCRAGVRP